MSLTLKKEDFAPHLNSAFEVYPEGMGVVAIELVEVTDKSSGSLDAFALLFQGGFGPVFRHDTHRVNHPELGEMAIFLGPVHTGKIDAVYYQAIFSTPK
ncbi:MAG: hypothetical protein HGA96_17550 [Desulfobulbaceae bacterium]|nr:hypothetical protein [Desulfobulbaceae bacterium]